MATLPKRPRIRKIGYVFVIMPHAMNLDFDKITQSVGYHSASNVQITQGQQHHEGIQRTYVPQIRVDYNVAPTFRVNAVEVSTDYRDTQRHNEVVRSIAARARRQSELVRTVVILNCANATIIKEMKSWRAEIRERFQIESNEKLQRA